MDKKAARPSFPQEMNEESMSTPASSPRNSTQETQAPTQESLEPLDYVYEGERTMSPPPAALEKAMDPSLDCQPDTPPASVFSSVSRSSTINSSSTTQTQDSDSTYFSQSSSAPDDTTSVFGSSIFPSVMSYPADRKSLPKGANVRVYELHKTLFEHRAVLPQPNGVYLPREQFGLGRINRYSTWPNRQEERRPAHKDQPSPLRQLTIPIEKSREATVLDNAKSFIFEGQEDQIVPEPSNMSSSLPENVTPSSTDIGAYNVFQHEGPPGGAGFYNQHMGTAIFASGLDIVPDHWMFGSLDSKHDNLYCESFSRPSTEVLAQRRKKLSRNIPMSNLQGRKAADRAKIVASQHYREDTQRPCNPDSAIYSIASTIIDSEGTVEPEPRSNEQHTDGESRQDSRSSTPSPPTKAPGQIDRGSSWSDSDDSPSLPHEHCTTVSEEDHDVAYKELVEGITNLISKSSCVGNTEDRGVPVELYVHSLLEKILNHTMSPTQSQTLCLPIRTHPMQRHAAQGEAGELDMRDPGQDGYGGDSRKNKRKNNEAPGHTHNRSYEDEDDAADGQEEIQSRRPEKVKKLKTGENDGSLSCPFRKRNPARFNVRDHNNCALSSFADYALLKRHIKTFHLKAHGSIFCVRCKKAFADQASLDDHLTLPEICSVIQSTRHEDPEDGITQEVDRALKARARDVSIRSWKPLWSLLFPDDNLNEIPGPDHEPPAELDEVQNYYYSDNSVRNFLEKQTTEGVMGITEHGFLYIVEGIRHWRKLVSHKHTKQRHQRDQRFVDTVRNELFTRQCGFQAQPQDGTPDHWEPNIGDILSFHADSDAYISQNSFPSQDTFLINPGYVNSYGVDCPQVPTNPAPYPSSEDPAQHAAPQHEPTPYSYTTMVAQNASPCSAPGGTADRSSGPSSQSRDSGDHTQATQDTQDTQYTQEQDSAHHQYHTGDDGAFGYPLAPGDKPGEHSTTTIRGPGSTDQIVYGAGDQYINAAGVSRQLE